MNQEILNAILHKDFKSFVIKVFNTVSAGSEYMDNWHIDVICDELMNMRDGKNNRLIINIPPRYMKSIICSVALPAYLLGHNPKTNIICVSYSDELTTNFASDCRTVMQSEWYRELFPMTRLQQSRRATNDFKTTHGGGRMATSIGGTLTGRGADWIIIDDPLKPMDAMSDTQRDKVNNWYSSTLYSRLNDKSTGKILLIMQRLHQDDLSGHLLDTDAGFKLIRLPIIATHDERWVITNRIMGHQKVITRMTGELLHPERENMDIITGIQKTLTEFAFSGQYQQDPCPQEGGIIKEKWLQYYPYDKFEINSVARLFISWDTANKTGENNAYSACCIIVMTKDKKFYLVDVHRGRWTMPELIKMVADLYNGWRYDTEAGHKVNLLIEDAASGTQLIACLQDQRDRRGYLFDIASIKPTGDKVSRLAGTSAYIENGRLQFPQAPKDWWLDFKRELLSFPGSRYKDQVDALSQAITYAQTLFN